MSKGRAAVRASFKLKGTNAPPPLADLQATAQKTSAPAFGSMTSGSASGSAGGVGMYFIYKCMLKC